MNYGLAAFWRFGIGGYPLCCRRFLFFFSFFSLALWRAHNSPRIHYGMCTC